MVNEFQLSHASQGRGGNLQETVQFMGCGRERERERERERGEVGGGEGGSSVW